MTNEASGRRFSAACPTAAMLDKLHGGWFVLVV
jgi:hypothetical protein